MSAKFKDYGIIEVSPYLVVNKKLGEVRLKFHGDGVRQDVVYANASAFLIQDQWDYSMGRIIIELVYYSGNGPRIWQRGKPCTRILSCTLLQCILLDLEAVDETVQKLRSLMTNDS